LNHGSSSHHHDEGNSSSLFRSDSESSKPSSSLETEKGAEGERPICDAHEVRIVLRDEPPVSVLLPTASIAESAGVVSSAMKAHDSPMLGAPTAEDPSSSAGDSSSATGGGGVGVVRKRLDRILISEVRGRTITQERDGASYSSSGTPSGISSGGMNESLLSSATVVDGDAFYGEDDERNVNPPPLNLVGTYSENASAIPAAPAKKAADADVTVATSKDHDLVGSAEGICCCCCDSMFHVLGLDSNESVSGEGEGEHRTISADVVKPTLPSVSPDATPADRMTDRHTSVGEAGLGEPSSPTSNVTGDDTIPQAGRTITDQQEIVRSGSAEGDSSDEVAHEDVLLPEERTRRWDRGVEEASSSNSSRSLPDDRQSEYFQWVLLELQRRSLSKKMSPANPDALDDNVQDQLNTVLAKVESSHDSGCETIASKRTITNVERKVSPSWSEIVSSHESQVAEGNVHGDIPLEPEASFFGHSPGRFLVVVALLLALLKVLGTRESALKLPLKKEKLAATTTTRESPVATPVPAPTVPLWLLVERP